jgi:hypothetical protein
MRASTVNLQSFAAQASEADLHADVGDRMLAPCQQEFRLVQPQLDAKLVRRETEQRLKPAYEVERRYPNLSRDFLNRELLLLLNLSQQNLLPGRDGGRRRGSEA